MQLDITTCSAAWFLPFVTPICLWVVFSDLRSMLIRNKAVVALICVFLIIGLICLPFPEYARRLIQFAIILLVGIIANSAGLLGAGDAKFMAAAAPFIAPGDVAILFMILSVNLLAAFATHRLVKNTPLRQLAPDWVSWSRDKKFPMGFSLGSTLVIYLIFGLVYGK